MLKILRTEAAIEPSDRAAGDVVAFALQLPPDFTHAVDLEVIIEHPTYLDLQAAIAAGAIRQAVHILALGDVLVVG